MSDQEPTPRPTSPGSGSAANSIISPNCKRVGKRLALIREELGKRHGEAQWTQEAVAKRVKLTQNIIWRIEQGEGGKIENWLKLMGIYESEGYNLSWILSQQNKQVSKLQEGDPKGKRAESGREAIHRVVRTHLEAIDSKWEAKTEELVQLMRDHLRTA